ncbi:hypothetical protein AVEN_42207-1 [Araneus ventricosus]|uniref:Uncharacterized protein n=1 Tax=Araneus ventricosus TaxID=182803 RepID=A0A4Y2B1J8_ARAVE|nr:hypothetical protein AVEN_42207-1 [Araneus ventricosus]
MQSQCTRGGTKTISKKSRDKKIKKTSKKKTNDMKGKKRRSPLAGGGSRNVTSTNNNKKKSCPQMPSMVLMMAAILRRGHLLPRLPIPCWWQLVPVLPPAPFTSLQVKERCKWHGAVPLHQGAASTEFQHLSLLCTDHFFIFHPGGGGSATF